MAERDRHFSPAVLAGDALLLLCALLGLTGSFLSLYGDQATVRSANTAAEWHATVLDYCAANTGQFLTWALLFALAALAVWSLPRFRWTAAGGLAALWALALRLNWEDVSSGAALTCKAIADQFAGRVDWGRTFVYDTGLSLTLDAGRARLFLIFALALLALLLGWAVVCARRWWVVLLLTLPPLLPGLLADLYPSWPAFMALAACWCAMLLCDLCKWAAPSGRGRLTLAVLPAVAAVLVVITLAFPREGYTRPAWALKAQEELVNLTSRVAGRFHWEGPFQSTITYVGAAEEADLSRAGPLRYSGRTVLRFTSDWGGRLYLRGSSLAVYEDGVWKALTEGTWQEYQNALPDPDDSVSPLIFPSLTLPHGGEYTATVDNVGAVGACVYAPYYLADQDWEAAGMLPVEDAYLARLQGQWKHTMTFTDLYPYSTSITEFINDLSSLGIIYHAPPEADAYRNYVYRYYLDVPAELQNNSKWMNLTLGLTQVGGSPSAVRLAEDVAEYLGSLCEYDPSAPAAPEGVDPVLYFLTESHRGYCMHYASAAALILRAMGIPARYVSGFTVESVPDQQVDVPDRAAHAWVEVWVDGFGWYPVEVTPAAAFTWYEQGATTPDELPSGAPPESEAPAPSPAPGPTAAPEPSQTPGAAQQPSAGPGDPGGDSPENGGTIPAVPVWLAKALAVAAGLCLLVWLGQFLPKRYRAKKLSGPGPNRAALYGYNCLRRMERWGGRVDGRALELAQKAKFSQHTLTQGELDELRGFVDLERERLCLILGPAERLAFRYVWGMPSSPKKRENTENSAGNGD